MVSKPHNMRYLGILKWLLRRWMKYERAGVANIEPRKEKACRPARCFSSMGERLTESWDECWVTSRRCCTMVSSTPDHRQPWWRSNPGTALRLGGQESSLSSKLPMVLSISIGRFGLFKTHRSRVRGFA
jgi:hypothetical protein